MKGKNKNVLVIVLEMAKIELLRHLVGHQLGSVQSSSLMKVAKEESTLSRLVIRSFTLSLAWEEVPFIFSTTMANIKVFLPLYLKLALTQIHFLPSCAD